MRKGIISLATLLLMFTATGVFAQRGPAPSPTVTVTQAIGNTEMTLVYSRPSLDGRSLSTLAPKGKVWRTGANTSTQISFNKDVTIGGKSLKAGDYSLWTIPGDSEWTIIINSVTGNWGTQYEQKNMAETDVFRFSAPATKLSEPVETFRIDLTDFDKNSKDKANIELAWANTSVKFPIEVSN